MLARDAIIKRMEDAVRERDETICGLERDAASHSEKVRAKDCECPVLSAFWLPSRAFGMTGS